MLIKDATSNHLKRATPNIFGFSFWNDIKDAVMEIDLSSKIIKAKLPSNHSISTRGYCNKQN